MVILVSMAILAAPLFEMTPPDVDACLAGLNARQCRYGDRVADLARAAIGTPYAADPLGEGPGAPYPSGKAPRSALVPPWQSWPPGPGAFCA